MTLITTADDFGWDRDTVATTVDLLERGIITNASIMANVAATDAALDYASSHPEFGWGVHLTLTRDGDESPVLPVSDVPGLVDDSGRFPLGRPAQIAAATGRLPVDQVVAELTAQIQRVIDAGVAVDYVDSHKHLHKYPVVGRALEQVLPTFAIHTVRRPQDRFVGSRRTRPSAWLEPMLRRRIVQRWTTTDHFFMPDGDPEIAWWEHLDPIRDGSLEVGCHPGRVDGWRDNERRGIETAVARFAADGVHPQRWRDLTALPSRT